MQVGGTWCFALHDAWSTVPCRSGAGWRVTWLGVRGQELVKEGRGVAATGVWAQCQGQVDNLTDSVDWYNVLRHHPAPEAEAQRFLRAQLTSGENRDIFS